jgi:predicted O-linked N-acetylglucosamine transferase (SPINDLY family)
MSAPRRRSVPVREALRRGHRWLAQGDLLAAHFAFEEVLTADPANVEALLALADCARRRNEPGSALAYARRAVAIAPGDAAALHVLGRLYKANGDAAAAEDAYRRGLEAAPDFAENAISLGIVLRAKGDLDGAIDCYRHALDRNPGRIEALVNLGNALTDRGDVDAAIETFRQAIGRAPEAAEAWVNLGRLLVARGRLDDADAVLADARRRFPHDSRVGREMGTVLEARGDLRGAGELYQSAALAAPDDLRAHHLYAEAVRRLGGIAESIPIYRHCLRLDPGDAEVRNNLSVALRVEGHLGEALELARQAVALAPGLVEAHASEADALTAMGRAAAADRIYAGLAETASSPVLANFLLTTTYVDDISPETSLERHRGFGDRIAARVAPPRPHPAQDDAERPLRIGYLSGDLRLHSVTCFLEPVLARHDPDAFQVHCYHTQAERDDVTARLQALVHGWVQAERLTDDALVERIRADGIDILVDLAGHTAGNRLPVFARKPAPVQALWLGYPTTSGLPAMDYRITDGHVDPEGYEAFNREALVRLPHSYYCYRPPQDAPDVAARVDGPITFASFNNLAKMGDACVDLWSRVLAAVPGSRLLLKARGLTDPACAEDVVGRFASRGMGRARLLLEGWNPVRGGHLALYGQADIALDTFPYNGGTTTCEALWMGLPVVSLSGRSHAARMGASLLHAAALPEFVTDEPDAFVRIASALAGDRERLSALRAGLRDHLRTSALMDEAGFTRDLESAYRSMWRRRCSGGTR